MTQKGNNDIIKVASWHKKVNTGREIKLMQISGKIMDRLTQIISLVVLLGIVVALISAIKGGNIPYITDAEDYAEYYAYTSDENEEQQ